MSELPEGWVSCNFGEINFHQSNTIVPSQFGTEIFELYSVPSFPTGQPEFVTGQEVGSMKQIVEPGDVLVCKINPRINRVWQVMPKSKYQQIASSEWIVFRSSQIDPRYLRYYFTSSEFRDLICEGVTGVGGSLTRAQPKRVAAFPIPLAPLAEQKRIADKLDRLLARVDGCRARLARVPAILKRFRQAVLAAATSGALTADWRENLGYGTEVTWPYSTAAELCEWITKGTTPAKDQMYEGYGDIPYIKVYNLCFDGTLDFTINPTFIDKATHNDDLKRSKVVPGDVLMNIVGPPLGKVSIVPELYPEWNINQAIAVFRPKEKISSKFLAYFLMTERNISDLVRKSKATAGQFNLTLELCRTILVPVPSFAEQHEIVRRVETLFGYADRLEARYAAARARVDQLTLALLAKAFRGELVAQDSADEPAAVLLERLRAVRGRRTD